MQLPLRGERTTPVTMTRRDFVGAGALMSGAAASDIGGGGQHPAAPAAAVDLSADGIPHSPAEYAALLARLAESGLEKDEYSRGGAVAALEAQFASLLGKEAAVLMLTGTLATQVDESCVAAARRRDTSQGVV